MADFVERYRAGQNKPVWYELMALGPKVREPAFLDQALEVARETMRRVRFNCELLIPRLENLGWQFKPEPWWPPDLVQRHPPRLGSPVSTERLDELDIKFGPMPLSLRAFYEIVGAINFVGIPFNRPYWPDKENLDPLYIAGIESNFENKQPDLFQEETEEFRREVIIAPDGLLKFFIAGVGCDVMRLPELGIDAPIYFDENEVPNKIGNQEMTLVRYLRLAFNYGGFLGFAYSKQNQLPEADLKYLAEGLKAI